MNPLYPTAHAAMRMSQRGLATDDIELIRWIGTEVEGGYWCAKRTSRPSTAS